jgi:hypothetical protein
MKRIKAGIALITMFGLLLGTASVASAKTTSPVHHAKVSHIATKSAPLNAKKVTSKKTVHKKSAKTIKPVKIVKPKQNIEKTQLFDLETPRG